MKLGLVPFMVVTSHWVVLHAPDGGDVLLNPEEVVSMRGPRTTDKMFMVEGAHCLINTSDGKYVSVRETCAEVKRVVMHSAEEPP